MECFNIIFKFAKINKLVRERSPLPQKRRKNNATGGETPHIPVAPEAQTICFASQNVPDAPPVTDVPPKYRVSPACFVSPPKKAKKGAFALYIKAKCRFFKVFTPFVEVKFDNSAFLCLTVGRGDNMKIKLRFQYNSPVVLTFALASLAALLLGSLTKGAITSKLFCVYYLKRNGHKFLQGVTKVTF